MLVQNRADEVVDRSTDVEKQRYSLYFIYLFIYLFINPGIEFNTSITSKDKSSSNHGFMHNRRYVGMPCN